MVVAVANAGQAAPVIGLIVLLAIWLGFGFWTAILALCLYAILPYCGTRSSACRESIALWSRQAGGWGCRTGPYWAGSSCRSQYR